MLKKDEFVRIMHEITNAVEKHEAVSKAFESFRGEFNYPPFEEVLDAAVDAVSVAMGDNKEQGVISCYIYEMLWDDLRKGSYTVDKLYDRITGGSDNNDREKTLFAIPSSDGLPGRNALELTYDPVRGGYNLLIELMHFDSIEKEYQYYDDLCKKFEQFCRDEGHYYGGINVYDKTVLAFIGNDNFLTPLEALAWLKVRRDYIGSRV